MNKSDNEKDNVITRETDFFKSVISSIKKMEAEIDTMSDGNLSCDNKWISGEAVMKKLRISKRTLQTYRDNGILPYSVVIGKFFYNVGDIEKMLDSNYVKY